jgi:hypothetical protein
LIEPDELVAYDGRLLAAAAAHGLTVASLAADLPSESVNY